MSTVLRTIPYSITYSRTLLTYLVLVAVASSSTMSVTESIYDHIVENGRTYHRYKEGKYMLPNDEVGLYPHVDTRRSGH